MLRRATIVAMKTKPIIITAAVFWCSALLLTYVHEAKDSNLKSLLVGKWGSRYGDITLKPDGSAIFYYSDARNVFDTWNVSGSKITLGSEPPTEFLLIDDGKTLIVHNEKEETFHRDGTSP